MSKDWIPHTTDDCPVEPGVMVEVELKSRERLNPTRASRIYWQQGKDSGTVNKYRIVNNEESTEELTGSPLPMHKLYPKYYRDVSKLDSIDIYRIIDLFEITDGTAQHALKKLILSGCRTGGKSFREDIKEARDTLTRRLDMWDEEDNTQ